MSDELTDTQGAAPVEGQAAVEPGSQDGGSVAEAGAAGGEDGGKAGEGSGAQPTLDEIIERAAKAGFDRTASWIGRRDKDLLNQVGQLINGIRSEFAAGRDPAQKQDDNGKEAFDAFVENPSRWLDQELSRRQANVNSRFQTIVGHAGQLMESDDLYQDRDFGMEVVNEVKNVLPTLPPNLDPRAAAELLVARATQAAIRKKGGVKGNAYSGKTAAGVPIGGVKPGSSVGGKPKVQKLSDKTEEFAKKWGYTQDDLAKIFPAK